MDADYPEHLLARESVPPYEGEGPFALWHFSEDPSLGGSGRVSRDESAGAAAGMGGRRPARADVLVPEGLPAGMHLAGVGYYS